LGTQCITFVNVGINFKGFHVFVNKQPSTTTTTTTTTVGSMVVVVVVVDVGITAGSNE